MDKNTDKFLNLNQILNSKDNVTFNVSEQSLSFLKGMNKAHPDKGLSKMINSAKPLNSENSHRLVSLRADKNQLTNLNRSLDRVPRPREELIINPHIFSIRNAMSKAVKPLNNHLKIKNEALQSEPNSGIMNAKQIFDYAKSRNNADAQMQKHGVYMARDQQNLGEDRRRWTTIMKKAHDNPNLQSLKYDIERNERLSTTHDLENVNPRRLRTLTMNKDRIYQHSSKKLSKDISDSEHLHEDMINKYSNDQDLSNDFTKAIMIDEDQSSQLRSMSRARSDFNRNPNYRFNFNQMKKNLSTNRQFHERMMSNYVNNKDIGDDLSRTYMRNGAQSAYHARMDMDKGLTRNLREAPIMRRQIHPQDLKTDQRAMQKISNYIGDDSDHTLKWSIPGFEGVARASRMTPIDQRRYAVIEDSTRNMNQLPAYAKDSVMKLRNDLYSRMSKPDKRAARSEILEHPERQLNSHKIIARNANARALFGQMRKQGAYPKLTQLTPNTKLAHKVSQIASRYHNALPYYSQFKPKMSQQNINHDQHRVRGFNIDMNKARRNIKFADNLKPGKRAKQLEQRDRNIRNRSIKATRSASRRFKHDMGHNFNGPER